MKLTVELNSWEELRKFQYANITPIEQPKNLPLDIDIGHLPLEIRSINALKAHDIFFVKQLVQLRPIDFLKMTGVGKTTILDIVSTLYLAGYTYQGKEND